VNVFVQLRIAEVFCPNATKFQSFLSKFKHFSHFFDKAK